MTASPMNMVMTVIGFSVSCLFMVFVCTRLVCARIQLNATRRSLPVSSRSNLSLLERNLHGLKPMYAFSFPTRKLGSDIFSSSLDVVCSICLSEYQLEETICILPHCGHSFHVLCIDKWLGQHSTCPICRVSLRELPDMNVLRIMPPLFSSAIGAPTIELRNLEDGSQMDASNVMESVEEDEDSSEENRMRKCVESPSTL